MYQFGRNGRGTVTLVALRGHRRGVRTRLGRLRAIRLGLFRQQLLVVAPLQKIHIIEPLFPAQASRTTMRAAFEVAQAVDLSIKEDLARKAGGST